MSPAPSPHTRRPRWHLRALGLTAAALLSISAASCGDDDDDEPSDDVDQTEVTSASNSAVPGQPQAPINTDPTDSQVTPTQAP